MEEEEYLNLEKIKDLSQSVSFAPNIKPNLVNSDIPDVPGYIDDFLQKSDAIYINGDKDTFPKKKKIKKVIKKKIKKKVNKNNSIELKEKEKVINESKGKDNNELKIEKKEESNKDIFSTDISSESISKKQSTNSDKGNEIKNNQNIPIGNKKTKDSIKKISIIENKKNEEKKIENKIEVNNKQKIKKIEKKKSTKENENKNNKKDEFKQKAIEKIKSIFEKYNSIIKLKEAIKKINKILKLSYFFIKIKENQKKSITKIASAYLGFMTRQNFKFNYLTLKFLNFRENCSEKIIAHYKGFLARKYSKPILKKKEDNYIIYSSLSNNKIIYFKSKFMNGLEDNIYFEYCKLLNCFIYYINRKEKNLSTQKLEGYFYNEKYKKLNDDMYEKNQKGENIINFPLILKKNDENNDKFDKVINEFIKTHKILIRKRYNLIEYEEKKKKALDDDMLLRHKKFEANINKLNRSKSFIKLKGISKSKSKGILKPSKSYINLRCDDKKIQFGKARIKRYQLKK